MAGETGSANPAPAGASGGRTYALNPFAAGAAGGDKTGAYAQGLRTYTRNQFAGEPTPDAQRMAPHLSQKPTLDQDIMAAYEQAKNYGYSVPDIQKTWNFSPTSKMFTDPNYQHDPQIQALASRLREERIHPKAEGWQYDSGDLGMGGGKGWYQQDPNAPIDYGAPY